MKRPPSFVVVIPVLNEEEGIGKTIDDLLSAGISRDNILVVDGGSVDRTVEESRSRGVRVIEQEGRGKADAIKTSLKHVDSEYIVVMDGDYTYPAKHVWDLLEKACEGYDLVIGARRRLEEGSQSLLYRFGNWAITKIFNVLYGTSLSDVLSGMYCAKRELLDELEFEFRGFSVESEIASHAVSTGRRVAEVPIEYRKRLGKKKLHVRHGIEIALNILRLTWRYNPTFSIFLLGTLLLVPGLYLDFYVVTRYLTTGAIHHIKALAGLSMTTAGTLSLLLSILSLYLKRMEIRLLRRLGALEKSCRAS